MRPHRVRRVAARLLSPALFAFTGLAALLTAGEAAAATPTCSYTNFIIGAEFAAVAGPNAQGQYNYVLAPIRCDSTGHVVWDPGTGFSDGYDMGWILPSNLVSTVASYGWGGGSYRVFAAGCNTHLIAVSKYYTGNVGNLYTSAVINTNAYAPGAVYRDIFPGPVHLQLAPDYGMKVDPASAACLLTPDGGSNAGPDGPCINCNGTNPINPGWRGNKAQVEVDYAGPGDLPLTFARTYNSRATRIAGLSPISPDSTVAGAWTHTYQRSLQTFVAPDNTGINTVQSVAVRRPNGNVVVFKPSGTSWVATLGNNAGEKLSLLSNGTWLFRAANDDTEAYSSAGRLTSITSRRGETQTLSYDAAGRVSQVVDAFGRTLAFAYNAAGNLQTLTDPSGGVTTYAYDASARLTGVTYPDGKTRTYAYENTSYPNALTGIVDERGVRYATWTYDAQGRGASSEHGASGSGVDRHTVTYNANGSATITDPLGSARTNSFTTLVRTAYPSGETQPAGSGCAAASTTRQYDANGNVTSRTDYNGNVSAYTWDLTRNLETKRVEASGKPEARTITTQWHTGWRVPVKVAEPKKITTYVYNGDTYAGAVVTCAPAGATIPNLGSGTVPIGVLCRKIEQATTDANGSLGLAAATTGSPRSASFSYDQFGHVLTVDGARTDVQDVTTFTYHAANDASVGRRGRLATVTDPLGHVMQAPTYDGHGRPLTIVDANGVTTTLAYDPRGRLTSRSAAGETTGYQYDAAGQLTRLTLPDGSFLSYTYDAAHRLTGVGDSLGNAVAYALDAAGNRTQEDVRDPAGQLSRTRSRAFDALSRLSQDIGAVSGEVTQYAYDANGNLTVVTDPLGHVTGRGYDALNRMTRLTDPAGGVTQTVYDGQGRAIQAIDPRGLSTSFTIDGLGNATAELGPDRGLVSHTFDDAGNRVGRTDARGQGATIQYDALNRPTLVTFSDGRVEATTWDAGANGVGRRSVVQESVGGQLVASTQYGYDAQGRVISEARTIAGRTYTTSYQYTAGRLSGVTYPSGRQVSYAFDAQGQISQIGISDQGATRIVADQIQYHPFGAVKRYVTGAGQVITRSQDLAGRTDGFTLGATQWQVGYDVASRVTYQTDLGNAAFSATYGYDALDRLVSAVSPTESFGYGYDPSGDRTSRTVGGVTASYTISATSHRLLGVGGSPAKAFTYDAMGNRTGDGLGTFSYDARGRLTQAVTPAGTISHEIDAAGLRVRRTSASEDTVYHYDRNGHLLAESTATGQVRREYVWLHDLPIGVMQ